MTNCQRAGAFTNPSVRLAKVQAAAICGQSGRRGDSARNPMRSPARACDFDQEKQIAVCAMSDATSATGAPS